MRYKLFDDFDYKLAWKIGEFSHCRLAKCGDKADEVKMKIYLSALPLRPSGVATYTICESIRDKRQIILKATIYTDR